MSEYSRIPKKEIAEVAKYTIKSSNIMANLSGGSECSQEIQDEVNVNSLEKYHENASEPPHNK
jgi:hypothetical protein